MEVIYYESTTVQVTTCIIRVCLCMLSACVFVSVCYAYGTCSVLVSRPSFWNTLPDYLRDPILPVDTFKRYLKHFLFALH